MPDNQSDGQHRDDGTAAVNSGQRTRRDRDVSVGQKGGGEEHGGSRVHHGQHSGDVSTSTMPPITIHKHRE